MKKVKNYLVEVMEYEYDFDEKKTLLDWLDQEHGLNYSVMRSGPKIIYPGKCHETLHHMVINIRK